MIVEIEYPHVFLTPCIVHSLDLALESISSNMTWIGELIDYACHICDFVQNHIHALTIYKEHKILSLLKIANTRFSSSFIMLKRPREVKAAVLDYFKLLYLIEKARCKCFKEGQGCSVWKRVDLNVKSMDPIILCCGLQI